MAWCRGVVGSWAPNRRRGSRSGSAGRTGTRCTFRDNGLGIAPEYHDKIFGLFERLDAAIEGTGIGLALVKRIVEMHGDRMWVESQGQGQGSTFCFALPRRVPGEP